MGTNCVPLVADLFLFFMKETSWCLFLQKSKGIEAFSSTSRYLEELLNIDNDYFDGFISQIYSSELHLNKANSSKTEARFAFVYFRWVYFMQNLWKNATILILIWSTFLAWMGASYGVYISQLNRFARVSSHVTHFNTRNKLLTAKLLNQGYRYHKLRKAFS